MNPATATDVDVAIVGLGPVGNTLAILLAQAGRRVAVLERWPAPYPLPRAVHFDHEVARIFQSCGIGEDLRGISEATDIYEWRNAAGTTLLRFGRRGDGTSGWPVSSMFNQPALERLLDLRAAQLPLIEVRRGVEVVAVEQDDEHAAVVTADGGRVTARYVVGCDGANSTVRAAIGVPIFDYGFEFDWLILDVILGEPRVFEPRNVQVCDPARPTTVVAGGPGRRRWEFMRLPGEDVAELQTPERAWELLAPWDVHLGNATLERQAVYTFNARYAEQWRDRRVLLAGDAAHLMPPFAGQGMCAGIRDAANLAWKLDAVLSGSADALLDTYEVERLPGARQAIEFSISLGNVICVSDPAAAAERDLAMAASVGTEPTEIPDLPGPDGGIFLFGSPSAGDLFVQGRVGGRLFDDVHGPGWRLVTIDDPADIERVAAGHDHVNWFASIGGAVVAVGAHDEWSGAWFEARGLRWALQRPDFRLYATAVDASGAIDALAALRSHLTTPVADLLPPSGDHPPISVEPTPDHQGAPT